ncbi:MAG: bifunctional 5,10-methylenetetrahydrofolate dehydrogenase/5,10-methenyltetrahydrofolate cyclohydrolase [Candidatus Thermoplasmatota archaeon]|nr:bifunctional 5,10-methylenetetrahydrofolate dehydrogenase/5,10-methenyltetrahydrofolate cyclohydrolase [Candidatus Thermoplasmatota archaeon]MED6305358.1 bifunctional 5,10-methylenetetrahydrofolate dehydrogenase/5,10-methenyltetrahydrofolate cyclohydrolase [Candidatus Thermoplasmatota archaeon]
MSARLIDGKKIAEEIESELKGKISQMTAPPRLSVVQIGDDPASTSYIKAKSSAAQRVGIELTHHHLSVDTSESELHSLIDNLNSSEDGIIVQLPLPEGLEGVLNHILPENDVDGFHPVNLGRLVQGKPGMRPCTPAGIVELLYRSGNDPGGKNIVVVGRSTIVGKPLSLLLSQKGVDATVTVCHSRTSSLQNFCKEADILVVATGNPGTVTGKMVKPGAVVIDVGVNRTKDGLVGDVSPDVKDVAGQLTPVPGGVGPMTVAMLMSNVVDATSKD